MNAPRQTYRAARVRPLPLRCGGARDRLSRFLGLARSLRGKPSRARRSVCDLYRLLAQARARDEGPKKHRSLRGCNDGVDPELLLPVWHAAALRAQALAAHGQYPAGTLHRPTGREPRYHVAIEELQDWAYTGNRLVPVKRYPGIVWERPKSRRRPRDVDDFEFLDRLPSARTVIVP